MAIVLVLIALEFLAACLAAVVAKQRLETRPIAMCLVIIAVADLIRLAISPWLGGSGRPFTGWQRLLFHIEQALFLTWPAGLAATCSYVFLRRRPRPVFVLYLIIVAVLIVGYPAIRGHHLAVAGRLFTLPGIEESHSFVVLVFQKSPNRTRDALGF